jgi:hypothetical protein
VSLIDGVLTVGEEAGVQCLQFVTNVTHIATSQGGTAFSSAADLATYAKSHGILSSTPALGDVAVWNASTNGADAAGHAGIVTALGSAGQVQVTSTNWPGGQGATPYTVGQGNNPIGMGLPSGYINPAALGGNNIITGVNAPVLTAATSGGSSSGGDCQGLTEILSGNAAGSSLPVVGGLVGAVTGTAMAPVSLIEWAAQPCKRWSFAVIAGALIATGIGFYLLFRREVDAGVETVGKAAAMA